jgi:EAL domain-containing protein (putative c-di-GMP-specific phosphodiesterase class I)
MLRANEGFVPLGGLFDLALKEIGRRIELRQRLEAERGGPISDTEFIEIADRTGLRI